MPNNYFLTERRFAKSSLFSFFCAATLFCQAQTDAKLPAVGTSAVIGKVDAISIEVKVQSPSAQATPLQVACVFEYTEGDLTNPPALPHDLNGMVHLDEGLKGLVQDLRKSGKFAGHELETLLITPPKGSIPAQKLLLVGLGDRNKFTPELMYRVGTVGMREALRLGVASYSHASDLKDAGVASPTGEVASNVVRGAVDAYRTQTYLKEKGASGSNTVVKFTLLSGPSFFADSKAAIQQAIAAYNN